MVTDTARPALGLPAAIRVIAADVLRLGVGATVPGRSWYRDWHRISPQVRRSALDALANDRAVSFSGRSAARRRITAVDLGRCWRWAGFGEVHVLLPTSESLEEELLERFLTAALDELGVEYHRTHLHGAGLRLDALRAGECDLVLVSSGTWLDLAADAGDSPDLIRLRRLPDWTYYGPGRVVTLRRRTDHRSRELRVAIDRDSLDHRSITEAAFPAIAGFEYVSCASKQVPQAVLDAEADAGIWHQASDLTATQAAGLRQDALGSRVQRLVQDRSAAVLAGRASNPELALLVDRLDLDGLGDALWSELEPGAVHRHH